MIYDAILRGGKGYGKPHVTLIVHGQWRAYYRGCYCIDESPSKAVQGVINFYDECFPGARQL